MRAVDLLERRLLLSAVYDAETGLLTVNGTNAGETIEVELHFDPGGSPSANEIRTRVGGVTDTFTGNPLKLPERVIINAGGGNDAVRVFASGGFPSYYDVISVEALGGDGNDTITMEFPRAASINGGSGNDTLTGGIKADVIVGGPGDDVLSGGADNDTLRGGEGNDQLYANEGDDSLEGGAGDDLLRGQDGNDTLVGNAGDDVLDGDRGYDTASYNDVAHYDGARVSIGDGANDGVAGEHDDVLGQTENLLGSPDNDTLIGDDGDNVIDGHGGWDSILGNGGQDRLVGGAENDTIYGGRGNDTLIGNGRKDFLYGERGDDLLDGGVGKDHVNGGPGTNTYNEGFWDSGPTDVLNLVGTLRYYNGVEGPDWKLQGGATETADNLLGLDVSAVQSQAEKLRGRRVRITGTVSYVPGDEVNFRVMTVTRISAA